MENNDKNNNKVNFLLMPEVLLVTLPSNLNSVRIPRSHKDFNYIYNYVVGEDATEQGFLDRFIVIANEAIEKYSNGVIKASADGMAEVGGLQIPADVLSKIKELQRAGYDWKSHENFWHRCQLNPRRESVLDLFRFISKHKLTITTQGTFIAYKAVTKDFKDKHTRTISNYPGCEVTMPREKVAFDPSVACSAGLHVANLSYAESFASSSDHIVLVEVDPSDVVSVPYDSNAEKIRCCRYKVLRLWNEHVDGELDTSVVSVSNTGALDVVKPQQQSRSAHRNSSEEGTPWTPTEDALLNSAVANNGHQWGLIASLLVGRDAKDCEARYRELEKESFYNEAEQIAKDLAYGLTRGCVAGSRWSEKEDDYTVRKLKAGETIANIAKYLGRTEKSVKHRLVLLRRDGKLK